MAMFIKDYRFQAKIPVNQTNLRPMNFQGLLVAAVLPFLTFARVTPDEVIQRFLHPADMRYITFKAAMDLMVARNLTTIVETGTARNGARNCGGDGCSTVIFSAWTAANPGMSLESVDINPEAVRQSQEAADRYNTMTNVVCSDSVEFLRNYPNQIDFLYLDSYDFDGGNPGPSQQHHLKEIVVAYKKLHKNSVVLVDDCGLIHGGKCTLVELVLKELGWKTVMKHYQLLMVPDPASTTDSFTSGEGLTVRAAAPTAQTMGVSKYEDLLLKLIGRVGALEEKLKNRENVVKQFLNAI